MQNNWGNFSNVAFFPYARFSAGQRGAWPNGKYASGHDHKLLNTAQKNQNAQFPAEILQNFLPTPCSILCSDMQFSVPITFLYV